MPNNLRPGRRAHLDPARLRAAREAKVLSPIELAALAGVHRNTVYGLEAGHIGASHKMVRQLAAALKVKPKALLRPEAVVTDSAAYRLAPERGEPVRTATGKVLTAGDLAALTAEAEAGYDVAELAKRPNLAGRRRAGGEL